MTEIQEVAQGMLASYERTLRDNAGMFNTINNANAFVMLDPILREESQARREQVAHALFRMARDTGTTSDASQTACRYLSDYRAWLRECNQSNSGAWALSFVCQTERLMTCDPGERQDIAQALARMARDADAIDGAPKPQSTEQTDADLNQAARDAGYSVVPHGDWWIAKDPNGANISAPLACNDDAWSTVRRVHAGMTHTEETARDAYWIAHAKALQLESGTRGTFAALIGEAFTRADQKNAARLIAAFPELLAD